MNNPNAVAAANTDFGFRLLRRLAETETAGNVFFSPLSLSLALSMTLNGAGRQTQRDMAAALGLAGLPPDQINKANARLLSSLAGTDPEVTLNLANALWASQDVTLAPAFQEQCRQFYAARAESLNFASPDAAGTINDWVSANTGGKILNIVSQADIAGAMVVLTNALYFHGLWQTPFDKDATLPVPFNVSGNFSKTVPMMRQSADFLYAEATLGQSVSLPYGDGRMSLFVLLPPPNQTIDALIQSLDAELWSAQIAEMEPVKLALLLPRFKAEYAAWLREPLSALGMAAAFESGADFGPMGLDDSFIGEVIHKATLDVGEKGTVAAAATAMAMTRGRVMSSTPSMRVDRPFFVAIQDGLTGTLLFAGVIRNPEVTWKTTF